VQEGTTGAAAEEERQECRKAQPVLLQRRRWLSAERDPLQRGEEVF
jgi:hypothetical protein